MNFVYSDEQTHQSHRCSHTEQPGVDERSGPEVIKHFSCLTQLSIKFQLFIKTKTLKRLVFLVLKLSDDVFTLLINIKNANNCWHFNINEQDKLHAELS